jgi:phage FluMu gp28-like protein
MVGLPDNPDTIRGFSGTNLLVIDEAARVSEEMYEALRPVLATTGGALWAMSTPNGKEGFFYREWTGSGPWTRIEVPAAECPRISEQFLEEERRTLGDEAFRQEYCCEFLSGEGALFDEAIVRSKISRSVAPLW